MLINLSTTSFSFFHSLNFRKKISILNYTQIKIFIIRSLYLLINFNTLYFIEKSY